MSCTCKTTADIKSNGLYARFGNSSMIEAVHIDVGSDTIVEFCPCPEHRIDELVKHKKRWRVQLIRGWSPVMYEFDAKIEEVVQSTTDHSIIHMSLLSSVLHSECRQYFKLLIAP